MKNVRFLFVTCCLEPTRVDILNTVINNICEQAPELLDEITVFDNASTQVGVKELLINTFKDVNQSNKNVGYWSAIDWWLHSLKHEDQQPKYTYIIESDMIHYDFQKIWQCVDYLDNNDDVGSVRLHEYSVKERHLYNKDAPRPDSRRGLWQSHTNKITGNPVKLDQSCDDIWSTTFLTQLPALNRFHTMFDVFSELESMSNFSEFDFQRFYWKHYNRTGILDGGIFHCNLNPYGAKVITGSWTDTAELQRIGYQPTRMASITPEEQYIVTKY